MNILFEIYHGPDLFLFNLNSRNRAGVAIIARLCSLGNGNALFGRNQH